MMQLRCSHSNDLSVYKIDIMKSVTHLVDNSGCDSSNTSEKDEATKPESCSFGEWKTGPHL
jgi:hypothetical protein